METSASFEARSAPSPYPTTGLKLRMKEPYEKGVAIRLGPESCAASVRDTVKRRQGIGGVDIQLRTDAIRTPTSLQIDAQNRRQ